MDNGIKKNRIEKNGTEKNRIKKKGTEKNKIEKNGIEKNKIKNGNKKDSTEKCNNIADSIRPNPAKDSAPPDEMPYEKFLRLGAGALTEPELLAIIIRTGTSDRPAVEIGKEILDLPSVKEDGLNGLHHVTVKELTAIKGIGEVKAVKVKCLAELSMRMAMMTAKKELQFLHPSTVAHYYMERMRHEQRERVLLLMLDTRNCLIGEELLSIGTVKVSLLSPREVFVAALKIQAVHIMLLHNHPSGDPSPSREDIEVTETIRQIGRMIDIPLIDHIIIGDNRYMSFKEAGLL